ncbi:MAG: hypothetical protein A2Z11_03265 [Candidatus Woykebacteria bacterium RBG_16_43_9]|uniref:S1 motif domain-containing protein n=1 Tax=Candidatus Woykebacteria bacterium RBG_16_43_9 TaxID=1802596 RepID=A0A1G1WCP3_9BACT|nr:MAG: hypothetical protein A2Z11_03265 [Candidatus Woykebacteria bacterium RBG_16_43_9]
MAKKDEAETSSQQSKIRGRVFSTEKPVSKIRERVFSPDTSGSKMAQLLAVKGFAPRALSKGETVEGQIVSILADSALVDIGSKAEGIIPLKELHDSGEKIEIGAKISAVIAQSEGDSGTAVLTVKKTIKERAWEQLQDISDKGEHVEVKGVGSNRGGLIVEYKGTRGFIPSSHLVTDARNAIGKNLTVSVIQVDDKLNKLVFSEKEVVGEVLPKVELAFKIGDSLDVSISKILPFGLLVSTPSGPDGLVHISEISWKKVSSLQDLYKIGQKIKVKVISIEANSGRINLSIKQLEKDPWKEPAKKYKVGSLFERAVSRATSYGVFVELEEGIEGLIHSSKIPYGVEYKQGDKVKIQVDLFDSDQKRVALRLAPDEDSADSKKPRTKPKVTIEKRSSDNSNLRTAKRKVS